MSMAIRQHEVTTVLRLVKIPAGIMTEEDNDGRIALGFPYRIINLSIFFRYIFLTCLLISAAALAAAVYRITRDDENGDFESEVRFFLLGRRWRVGESQGENSVSLPANNISDNMFSICFLY